MRLLLDTHILAWIIADDARLKSHVRDAIDIPENILFVSAVTAWEFQDLALRGRLSGAVSFASVMARLDMEVLDTPSGLWQLAERLPNLHGDPVDRMVIAHAIHDDLTLVTADDTMRLYPVAAL